MSKIQQEIVHDKDGLQIVIRCPKGDNRLWVYKTIIQNLFNQTAIKQIKENKDE